LNGRQFLIIRKLSRLSDTQSEFQERAFVIFRSTIGLVLRRRFSKYSIFGLHYLFSDRFGLPREVMYRMILALEAEVGRSSFAGDLFDAYYKSNVRGFGTVGATSQAVEPELERYLAFSASYRGGKILV